MSLCAYEQMYTNSRFQACATLEQVYIHEGVQGFYRGFLPVLAGVLPASMLYFYAYETAKKLISGRLGTPGDFVVGCAAQLSAGLVFTPVDVIKERLQASLGFQCPAATCQIRTFCPLQHLRSGAGKKHLSSVPKQ